MDNNDVKEFDLSDDEETEKTPEKEQLPDDEGVLADNCYDWVVGEFCKLNVSGFIRWLGDEKMVQQFLEPLRNRSSDYKKDFFTLFSRAQKAKRDADLLKKVITSLQKHDIGTPYEDLSNEIKTVVNFILTSSIKVHWTKRGWSTRFVDINIPSEHDHKTAVHVLASSAGITENHLRAINETFWSNNCIPDLSITVSDGVDNGMTPLQIASKYMNIDFLTLYGMSYGMIEGSDDVSVSGFKQTMRKTLQRVEDALEEAKNLCL
jgi:hypothetical protein